MSSPRYVPKGGVGAARRRLRGRLFALAAAAGAAAFLVAAAGASPAKNGPPGPAGASGPTGPAGATGATGATTSSGPTATSQQIPPTVPPQPSGNVVPACIAKAVGNRTTEQELYALVKSDGSFDYTATCKAGEIFV